MSDATQCDGFIAELGSWILDNHSEAEIKLMTSSDDAVEKAVSDLFGRHRRTPAFIDPIDNVVRENAANETLYDQTARSVVRDGLRYAARSFELEVSDVIVDDAELGSLEKVEVAA